MIADYSHSPWGMLAHFRHVHFRANQTHICSNYGYAGNGHARNESTMDLFKLLVTWLWISSQVGSVTWQSWFDHGPVASGGGWYKLCTQVGLYWHRWTVQLEVFVSIGPYQRRWLHHTVYPWVVINHYDFLVLNWTIPAPCIVKRFWKWKKHLETTNQIVIDIHCIIIVKHRD